MSWGVVSHVVSLDNLDLKIWLKKQLKASKTIHLYLARQWRPEPLLIAVSILEPQ